MKGRDILRLGWTIVAGLVCGAWSYAIAQNAYPERPIRMVIPFASGGATDLHGRMLAQRMSVLLGQNIVVDARPGASGIVGTDMVVRARPDGYTVLLGTSSTLIIAPMAVKKPPYNALKDLINIAIIGVQPVMIVATPGLPVKTLRELTDLLKANPGKYNYATSGSLSVNQLMMEMYKKQAGNLDVTLIPYSGTNEVARDLLSGRVHLAALTATGALDLYRAGRLRVLAVCAETRLRSAPEIPTSVESGMPDLLVSTFNAISVPAGTPKRVVDRLSQTLAKIMASDDYVKDLDKLGMDLFAGSTPEKTSKFISDLLLKWAPQIKELAAQQGG